MYPEPHVLLVLGGGLHRHRCRIEPEAILIRLLIVNGREKPVQNQVKFLAAVLCLIQQPLLD